MRERAHDRRNVTVRRDQLVEAAIEVLADEGLSRATTRRITQRAGLALGAFHYAFGSKTDLMRAVIERISGGIEAVLRDAVVSSDGTLGPALDAVVEGFWSFAERSPNLLLANYELTVHALRDPELRPLVRWQYDRYVAAVASVLDRADGAPTGDDRDDLARSLVASLEGLVLQGLVHGDQVAARRRVELYRRSLRHLEVADVGAPA